MNMFLEYWRIFSSNYKKRIGKRNLQVAVITLFVVCATETGTSSLTEVRLTDKNTLSSFNGSIFSDVDSIAVYGNRLVIGVDGATYQNGYSSTQYDYGYAYVYEYDSINKEWQEVSKLEPNNNDISAQFGAKVAINDKFIAVGSAVGNVYIFELINGTWNQTFKINTYGSSLTMNNIEDNFGLNNRYFLVVGATGSSTAAGIVYVYEYDSINQRWNDTYTYG